MLAEMIDKIAEMATRGNSVEVVQVDKRTRLIVSADGTYRQEYVPRYEVDNVASVDDLIVWATAAAGGSAEGNKALELSVSPTLVRAHWNKDSKNERAAIGELLPSVARQALFGWTRGVMTQAAAVRRLRTELADTFDPRFLAVLRRLDFQRRNDGSRTIAHNRESLGKAIEAIAQSSEGEVPEVVAFNFPWFAASSFAAPAQVVGFAVELNASEERIGLFAIGDDWERAENAAIDRVKAYLVEALPGALVYRTK